MNANLDTAIPSAPVGSDRPAIGRGATESPSLLAKARSTWRWFVGAQEAEARTGSGAPAATGPESVERDPIVASAKAEPEMTKNELLLEAARQHNIGRLRAALWSGPMNAGASRAAEDEDGNNAAHLAVLANGKGERQVIVELFVLEIDLSAKNDAGLTPADLARRAGRPETAALIEALVAAG